MNRATKIHVTDTETVRVLEISTYRPEDDYTQTTVITSEVPSVELQLEEDGDDRGHEMVLDR